MGPHDTSRRPDASDPGLTLVVDRPEPVRAVIRLRGELDVADRPVLQAAADDLFDAGTRHLAIDLADLRFMDSSGIAALVITSKRYTSAGRAVTLHAPTPVVRRLLDITGVATAIPVEPDPA